MVTERLPADTDTGAAKINRDKEWRFRPIFGERQPSTQRYRASVVVFPVNRFLSEDDELMERMLLLSAEALEGGW